MSEQRTDLPPRYKAGSLKPLGVPTIGGTITPSGTEIVVDQKREKELATQAPGKRGLIGGTNSELEELIRQEAPKEKSS